MSLPDPSPISNHLATTSGDAVADAEAVKTMLESPGWEALMRSIDKRLAFEQRIAMQSAPGGGEAAHERRVGTWMGLRIVPALAAGLVEHGRAAEAKMRDAAEAA